MATPPAENRGHGQLAFPGDLPDEFVGGPQFLGGSEELGVVQLGEPPDLGGDLPHVADGFDHVAGTGLSLGADQGRAFGDAAQGLTQVGGTAHERHGEVPLVDVVGLISGGEDLGLVDEVHFQGLEDLGFDEVADADLRHDRDGHGVDDALDHLRVGHAGHTAVLADVGGDTLQRHDGDCAGVFSDLGLLRRDHIHDHTALELFGHAAFDADGTDRAFGCVLGGVGHGCGLQVLDGHDFTLECEVDLIGWGVRC